MTFSPAADRNKAPILEVLTGSCPIRRRCSRSRAEPGSTPSISPPRAPTGTGSRPTPSASALASIASRYGCARERPPAADAGRSRATLARAARSLRRLLLREPAAHRRMGDLRCADARRHAHTRAGGGAIVLYGPYVVDGEPTAPGNAAFDADLRERNPAWGLRRLAEVIAETERAGLAFERRVDMPANNLLLVFRRSLG